MIAMNSILMSQSCKDPAYAPVKVKKLSLRSCAPRNHNNVTA